MSITLSGLIFGLVLGRVFAGLIATLGTWRDTYWMAVGLQGGESEKDIWRCGLTVPVMTGLLWLTLPDTPDKDIGLSYFQVVSSF